MSSPLLNTAANLMCAHGGSCKLIVSSSRVKIGGVPCATAGSSIEISGCPSSGATHCATAQVVSASARVKVSGQPVLTQSSVVLAAPSGQSIVVVNPGQHRVTSG